jgi:hypothetical protein
MTEDELEVDEEVLLIHAVSALVQMNRSPGQHIITIPNDPDGNWEYEFKEATNDRNHD